MLSETLNVSKKMVDPRFRVHTKYILALMRETPNANKNNGCRPPFRHKLILDAPLPREGSMIRGPRERLVNYHTCIISYDTIPSVLMSNPKGLFRRRRPVQ